MLFWKIGAASAVTIEWSFYAAPLGTLCTIYALSLVLIRTTKITDYQAGTFSQSCYRFNTYIGMAVIINALGGEAAGIFGMLIGFMIPVINVLAVATLIWYSGKAYAVGEKTRLLIKALLSNPLIIGCATGILYAHLFQRFPVFIDNTLRLASFVTLPLALLSIGGSLTFANFKTYHKPSLLAAVVKLLALPAVGYGLLRIFGVTGVWFDVTMIFFALPTSTAIYVLSSQLNSDARLASASIVVSTLLSVISLTVILTMVG